MNCPHCNKKIDADSKFCVFCGSGIIEQQAYSRGNLVPFNEAGLWGFKDKNSRDIIVQPKYDTASEFVEERAIVTRGGKFSALDNNGVELGAFKFDYISMFNTGLARAKRDGLYSYIDSDCKQLTPFKYDYLEEFKGDLAKVGVNGKFTVINRQGEELFDGIYEFISDFEGGYAFTKANSKVGLISKQGKEVLKAEYNEISPFTSGYSIIRNDANLYGLLDIRGEIKVPCKYKKIWYVENQSPWIITENRQGKGFIVNGKESPDTNYKSIKIIAPELIAVKLEGEWRCFDKNCKDISESSSRFRTFLNRKRGLRLLMLILSILFFISLLSIYDSKTNTIGFVNLIGRLTLGEDEMLWRHAVTTYSFSNLDPLEEYIDAFPNGSHIDNAKEVLNGFNVQIDENHWEASKQLNTIDSYNNYLSLYPQGIFQGEAKKNISWISAKEVNRLQAYRKFIKDFPKSNEAIYIQNEIKSFDEKFSEWKSNMRPESQGVPLLHAISYEIYKTDETYYYKYDSRDLPILNARFIYSSKTLKTVRVGPNGGNGVQSYLSKDNKYLFVNNNWKVDNTAASGGDIQRYSLYEDTMEVLGQGRFVAFIESGKFNNTIVIEKTETSLMKKFYCLFDFNGQCIFQFNEAINVELFFNSHHPDLGEIYNHEF